MQDAELIDRYLLTSLLMNLRSGCRKAGFAPPIGLILDYFKMDQLSTAEISALFRRNGNFFAIWPKI